MNDLLNTDLSFVNHDDFLLFFGSFYIILGLSIFLAGKAWQEFINLFIKHDSISLVLGVFTLPIGLFIVVFYNNWDSLASTILMIMGYISIIKSLLLFLTPGCLQGFLARGYIQKYLWLDGLSGILLGLAMLIL